MATYDDLELYVLPGCPYCEKVDSFLNAHNIQIKHVDVTEESNKEQLITIGGKYQCPCLIIAGKPLYESDDIIDYMAERAGV